MKTTLDLPDDLMRSIKVKAAREDRKLKDVVAELLQRGLDLQRSSEESLAEFPVIPSDPATPETEMTPERIKQLLLDEELGDYLDLDAPREQKRAG